MNVIKTNSFVSADVILRNERNIHFGANVAVRDRAIIDGRAEGSCSGVFLGDNVVIGEYAVLDSVYGRIDIGSGTSIGQHSVLYGQGGLVIGKNVLIANTVTIVPANHYIPGPDELIKDQISSMKGIQIGDDVWIGAQVCILDGVTIGNGTIIGAGSIVTGDIPPNSIAYGIPCRMRKKRGSFLDRLNKKFSSHRDIQLRREHEKLKGIVANRDHRIKDLEKIVEDREVVISELQNKILSGNIELSVPERIKTIVKKVFKR